MKTILQRLVALFTCFISFCLSAEDLQLLISPQKINKELTKISSKIDMDYKGEPLTIIMVMKGAVCIGSDLIRNLKTPTELEYVQASSYGKKGEKRGELKLIGLENLDLTNKNVLVVDDIFDSGNTMVKILDRLKSLKPKSLKSLVVFVKKIQRETTYRPDYVLFDIDNHFIVGYGLDYKEKYRGLPGIYKVVLN